MTLNARSWLPEGTSAPRPVLGALADVVDRWSAEWFAGVGARIAGTFARIAEPRGELRKIVWHMADDLAIGISEVGVSVLGADALGVSSMRTARPTTDLQLLQEMGNECLDDLKRRLAEFFGLRRGAAWTTSESPIRQSGTVHRLEIVSGERSLVLTLELSGERFARYLKSRLSALPSPGPLGSAEAALAPLRVHLSAVLGTCNITVSELSALEVGDVLVLERALDAPLPLALEGAPLDRGACALAEDNGALAFRITQAPIG